MYEHLQDKLIIYMEKKLFKNYMHYKIYIKHNYSFTQINLHVI